MKVDLNKCLYLTREIILSMELDMINNDSYDHFQVRGWLDKFGEGSHKLSGNLTSSYPPSEQVLLDMAKEIKEDFDNGYWKLDKDGAMYHYMMPTRYGGYIDKAIEIQLADLTKIGTQTELNLN